MQASIARGLAYAPFADLLWMETSTPDMAEAKQFADAIHAKFPGKMLAYNCSPSFNWKLKLSDAEIASYQKARPLLPCSAALSDPACSGCLCWPVSGSSACSCCIACMCRILRSALAGKLPLLLLRCHKQACRLQPVPSVHSLRLWMACSHQPSHNADTSLTAAPYTCRSWASWATSTSL